MPLLDKSARSVVNAIMTNWISLYGAPATIRMDQGKEFDNALLKNLLNALDVNIKVGFSQIISVTLLKDFLKLCGHFWKQKRQAVKMIGKKVFLQWNSTLFNQFLTSQNFSWKRIKYPSFVSVAKICSEWYALPPLSQGTSRLHPWSNESFRWC